MTGAVSAGWHRRVSTALAFHSTNPAIIHPGGSAAGLDSELVPVADGMTTLLDPFPVRIAAPRRRRTCACSSCASNLFLEHDAVRLAGKRGDG
ncbi:MAG: hypothetical protein HC871_08815 [Rhizobiales bacterium]|nr:hypothetical protein [Hyphomicrobiales bacterium]